ncbi:MAG: PQQ-binding-like beta-propeller repeat protein [Chloroflexota bacterium]
MARTARLSLLMLVMLVAGCIGQGRPDAWVYPVSVTEQTPSLEGSLVVIGHRTSYAILPSGLALVLDSRNGRPRASVELQKDTYRSAEVLPGGEALIAGDRCIVCIDEDGRIRWEILGDSTPTAPGEVPTIITTTSSTLLGLSATGGIVWRNAGMAHLRVTLGDVVIGLSRDGSSFAGLSIRDGSERWRNNIDQGYSLADLTSHSGRCYMALCRDAVASSIDDLASDDWNFRPCRILSVSPDGTVDWALDLTRRFAGVELFAVEDGLLVVGQSFDHGRRGPDASSHFAVCVSYDGAEKWELPLPPGSRCPPVSDGCSLYFAQSDGRVLRLAADGRTDDVAQFERGARSHLNVDLLAVVDGAVFATVNRTTLARIPLRH